MSSWQGLEQFRNTRRLSERIEGCLFLDKKALERVLPVYTNSETAIKPNYELIGFIGLTEVMPLLQSLRKRTFGRVFHQAAKSCPFYKALEFHADVEFFRSL